MQIATSVFPPPPPISYKYCHQGLWDILSKNVSPSQHITQLWKMTGCTLTLDGCLTLRTVIIYYFQNSHSQKGVEPIFLVFYYLIAVFKGGFPFTLMKHLIEMEARKYIFFN